jgi:hypothetical protein
MFILPSAPGNVVFTLIVVHLGLSTQSLQASDESLRHHHRPDTVIGSVTEKERAIELQGCRASRPL